MTEFAYVLCEHKHDKIFATESRAATTKGYDAIVFDSLGLSNGEIIQSFRDCRENLLNNKSVLIFMYKDVMTFVRHVYLETTRQKEPPKVKPRFNFSIDVRARSEVAGSDRMTSQIERIAVVYSASEISRNEKANKNTYIEGDRAKILKGVNPRKIIGGDSIAKILHKFDYDDWENVLVANFENPLISSFSDHEPKSPTERFSFLLVVADSNIRVLSKSKMNCAVDDVFCNWDWCPDSSEITEMMKTLEENGL